MIPPEILHCAACTRCLNYQCSPLSGRKQRSLTCQQPPFHYIPAWLGRLWSQQTFSLLCVCNLNTGGIHAVRMAGRHLQTGSIPYTQIGVSSHSPSYPSLNPAWHMICSLPLQSLKVFAVSIHIWIITIDPVHVLSVRYFSVSLSWQRRLKLVLPQIDFHLNSATTIVQMEIPTRIV